MNKSEYLMELKGRRVDFMIRDIHYPPYEAVLRDLHGNDAMSGEVVDVTDAATEPATFAVVRVDGLGYPVIVPANRVRD
jgi:hypothetical protein